MDGWVDAVALEVVEANINPEAHGRATPHTCLVPSCTVTIPTHATYTATRRTMVMVSSAAKCCNGGAAAANGRKPVTET